MSTTQLKAQNRGSSRHSYWTESEKKTLDKFFELLLILMTNEIKELQLLQQRNCQTSFLNRSCEAPCSNSVKTNFGKGQAEHNFLWCTTLTIEQFYM